jgi:hypothetical protein
MTAPLPHHPTPSRSSDAQNGEVFRRFETRQKIRWDAEFLYIGAELEAFVVEKLRHFNQKSVEFTPGFLRFQYENDGFSMDRSRWCGIR